MVIHPAESTRERLLDAAEALFGEHGYDAVGIRQIADQAGVNLSGIKYHFGSKRGLYLETVRRTMDRRGSTAAWSLLDRPVGSQAEAATALRAFVGAFLRVLLDPGDDACSCLVMHAAAQPGDATDLVVSEFIKPHFDRLDQLVGVLSPGATERERSRYVQSVMALLMHQRMFRPFLDRLGDPLADPADGDGPSDEAIDRLADELTDFALRGMACSDLLGAGTDQTENAGVDS